MINNLEAYKVFYYVAKCGSVTKAAGELSISQPAVSQAIKQLENTLDAALFHRAAKGVRLTSEGELLYSYVAKGYEQIEMGVKKVHQMQNMELGEVRIGASDMTLQFYLLPYLEKFHEQYPGIKVIVQFVRRNLGVGCVMRDFARDYVESGLLFELRFNKIIPKRQFCVVRNTKMPMAPAAEKLLEIMELDRQEEAKI